MFLFPTIWPIIQPTNVNGMLTLRQAPRILMMRTSLLTNHLCASLWLVSPCLSAFCPILWSQIHVYMLLYVHPTSLSQLQNLPLSDLPQPRTLAGWEGGAQPPPKHETPPDTSAFQKGVLLMKFQDYLRKCLYINL